MELTFDNFAQWFDFQDRETQDRLISENLTPEVVVAAYDRHREKRGSTQEALEKFKTNIVYQIFYFSLPKQQRHLLEKDGIRGGKRDKKTGKAVVGACHDGDEVYKIEANQNEVDVADSVVAKVECETYRDDKVSETAERLGVDYETALRVEDMIRERLVAEVAKELVGRLKTLLALLLGEPNLRIAAGALAFAADLAAINGLGTQRGFAAKIGVTPAAVSKQVIRWKTRLSLPTNAHMKSDAARKSFSDAQKSKHWRRRIYGSDPAATGPGSGA